MAIFFIVFGSIVAVPCTIFMVLPFFMDNPLFVVDSISLAILVVVGPYVLIGVGDVCIGIGLYKLKGDSLTHRLMRLLGYLVLIPTGLVFIFFLLDWLDDYFGLHWMTFLNKPWEK